MKTLIRNGNIITATDDRTRGLRQGAIAFLKKPVTREALSDAFTNAREEFLLYR